MVSSILACNHSTWDPITFSSFQPSVSRGLSIPHFPRHSLSSLETHLYVAQDCTLLVCWGAIFGFPPPYFWVHRPSNSRYYSKFILSKVISLLHHAFWKAINCSTVSFRTVPPNLRSLTVFLLSHDLLAVGIFPGSVYAFESKYKYILNPNL